MKNIPSRRLLGCVCLVSFVLVRALGPDSLDEFLSQLTDDDALIPDITASDDKSSTEAAPSSSEIDYGKIFKEDEVRVDQEVTWLKYLTGSCTVTRAVPYLFERELGWHTRVIVAAIQTLKSGNFRNSHEIRSKSNAFTKALTEEVLSRLKSVDSAMQLSEINAVSEYIFIVLSDWMHIPVDTHLMLLKYNKGKVREGSVEVMWRIMLRDEPYFQTVTTCFHVQLWYNVVIVGKELFVATDRLDIQKQSEFYVLPQMRVAEVFEYILRWMTTDYVQLEIQAIEQSVVARNHPIPSTAVVKKTPLLPHRSSSGNQTTFSLWSRIFPFYENIELLDYLMKLSFTHDFITEMASGSTIGLRQYYNSFVHQFSQNNSNASEQSTTTENRVHRVIKFEEFHQYVLALMRACLVPADLHFTLMRYNAEFNNRSAESVYDEYMRMPNASLSPLTIDEMMRWYYSVILPFAGSLGEVVDSSISIRSDINGGGRSWATTAGLMKILQLEYILMCKRIRDNDTTEWTRGFHLVHRIFPVNVEIQSASTTAGLTPTSETNQEVIVDNSLAEVDVKLLLLLIDSHRNYPDMDKLERLKQIASNPSVRRDPSDPSFLKQLNKASEFFHHSARMPEKMVAFFSNHFNERYPFESITSGKIQSLINGLDGPNSKYTVSNVVNWYKHVYSNRAGQVFNSDRDLKTFVIVRSPTVKKYYFIPTGAILLELLNSIRVQVEGPPTMNSNKRKLDQIS